MVVGAGSIPCRMVGSRRGTKGIVAGGRKDNRRSSVYRNEAGIFSNGMVGLPERSETGLVVFSGL